MNVHDPGVNVTLGNENDSCVDATLGIENDSYVDVTPVNVFGLFVGEDRTDWPPLYYHPSFLGHLGLFPDSYLLPQILNPSPVCITAPVLHFFH